MNKKISIVAVLLGLMFCFISCSDNDNDDEIPESWKTYQRSVYNRVIMLEDENGERVFKELPSLSGMGSIYVRNSDFITNNENQKFEKDAPIIFPKDKEDNTASTTTVREGRYPYDTDVVMVRYEGWYFSENEEKIIFDSTERILSTYEWNNNALKDGREFVVYGVVDGFKTLLQNMKVGDEKIVCIPYQLAYGEYNQDGGIPGYTTLFFNVKMMRNLTEEKEPK